MKNIVRSKCNKKQYEKWGYNSKSPTRDTVISVKEKVLYKN